MASGPITSWQINGETMETVADFIFLGSKITADGDCSHEIKRHLLLGSGEGNGNPLQYYCLENPMAEEPSGLQSMGLQRTGHN